MLRAPDTVERDHVEECRVDQLAAQRRTYGTRPQPASLGPDLHLREHVAVGERAAPESEDRGGDDARRVTEYRLDGGLVRPPARCRQCHHDRRHERGEDQRTEAGPHHAPVAGVAVDLGEDVAEQIGDREEQHARHECDGAEQWHVHGRKFRRPDQVRAQQDADVRRHDQVVVLERAWTRSAVGGRGTHRRPLLRAWPGAN